MYNRVVIRRARPHIAALAIAFLLTALAFYMLTLIVKRDAHTQEAPFAVYANQPRVTVDCMFEGGVMYFVYLCRDTDVTRARVGAARYLRQGAAGYLYASDGFVYALGNAYADAGEAEAAAARIRETTGIDCATIEIAAPALRARLTAAQAQIDAAQAGYKALLQAEEALRAIADRLDAGTLSASGARSFAAICVYDIENAADALRSATPDSSDAFCLSLRARLTDAYNAAHALTAGQDTEMYLSARFKHTRIDMILNRYKLLTAFAV